MKRNTAKPIPMVVVRRLCIYKRFLERVQDENIEETSSQEMARKTGIPSYQIRKDINYLGEIGNAGKGYSVSRLIEHITEKLGLHQHRKAIIAGVGSLGTALASFLSKNLMKYDIVAGFDIDPQKVGKKKGGLPIYHISEMRQIIGRNKVEMGLISVDAQAAQEIAELMIDAGIKAIVNFAPVMLRVPPHIVKCNIDVGIEIETLFYLLMSC